MSCTRLELDHPWPDPHPPSRVEPIRKLPMGPRLVVRAGLKPHRKRERVLESPMVGRGGGGFM